MRRLHYFFKDTSAYVCGERICLFFYWTSKCFIWYSRAASWPVFHGLPLRVAPRQLALLVGRAGALQVLAEFAAETFADLELPHFRKLSVRRLRICDL